VEPTVVLTPSQQRVVSELMAAGTRAARPHFPDDLARTLRAQLHDALAPAADRLALLGAELHVNKSELARVHQCERFHQAEAAAGFPGWSKDLARGVVAHRAIELGVFMAGEPAPLELVDAAIDRIIEDGDDHSPRSWLLEAPATELAELRSAANDLVCKFEECFPPLKKAWRPRLESSVRVELHGGQIMLRSKVDLALGRAEGTQAGVLVVDFKSGRAYPHHIDDLRYYALLETFRSGVPPFRVASYYLDAGNWHHEDVTEELLAITMRRVIDGIDKLAALRTNERAPTFTPGPACGYCRVRDACEGARQWAEQREERGELA
jgi:hypothetical protein